MIRIKQHRQFDRVVLYLKHHQINVIFLLVCQRSDSDANRKCWELSY
ncbi:TPA: hypothetical protein ACHTFF_001802 [Clostridioides difficile]|uniref:Uncharacterized protein n=1 Tax=Clostridioides difficile TaxID=1496 RepID=A0A069AJY3_CLODI|nr:hypothetical protein [Clostridioides difficile]CCL81193.1 hypothetical protein BN187_2740008 [Clostridioides difficile E12]CCL92551.1 hypothetical protein BN190_3650018 [Clostridioides difficile T14]EII6796021.1 hypothetical protein [Clostridioides difficile]EII6803282.1 hypothetical protein [Clostridioides difficile]EIS9080368.1 hypothetical protein [Clostridioides difficile]